MAPVLYVSVISIPQAIYPGIYCVIYLFPMQSTVWFVNPIISDSCESPYRLCLTSDSLARLWNRVCRRLRPPGETSNLHCVDGIIGWNARMLSDISRDCSTYWPVKTRTRRWAAFRVTHTRTRTHTQTHTHTHTHHYSDVTWASTRPKWSTFKIRITGPLWGEASGNL